MWGRGRNDGGEGEKGEIIEGGNDGGEMEEGMWIPLHPAGNGL
jgi:hypothetical protein